MYNRYFKSKILRPKNEESTNQSWENLNSTEGSVARPKM